MSEQGVVRFFDQERNFGFATRDGGGPDVYLHAKQCPDSMLQKGDRIEFEAVHDAARGTYWAKAIRVL
ncbi:hypothetical protein CQ12_06055 [Bradyrhizobium jicamae]|uniref:CSD domain-containing protein n=1 Tax=Bradyrhizobium jicamae TaxID=280332 RepID=A0A0R3LWH8_9BRAD|nr:cold shock domain-containing protein [Bradyrhizobium jicamae]KRR09973.1 hypothetical protein CQ12_06055 [Bradyrhizobium jicamae]